MTRSTNITAPVKHNENKMGRSLSGRLQLLFDNHALVHPHIKTNVLAGSDSSLNVAGQHSKHLCLARLPEFVADEIQQFITKAAG